MILKYFFFATIIVLTNANHWYPGRKALPRTHTANEQQDLNIAMNLDQTVKPCDDFYANACGSYAEHHRDSNYEEITTKLDNQYNLQLLNLMDSIYQQDHQVLGRCQTFIEKARIYLKSCRTQVKREIKKYFEVLTPGEQLNWPIWDEQQWQSVESNNLFDVWSLLGKMHSYGLNNVLVNQEILVHENGTFSVMLEPVYAEDNTTLPDPMLMQVFLKNLDVARPKKIFKNLEKLNEKLLQVLAQTAEESDDKLELQYHYLDAEFPHLHLKQFLRELLQRELTGVTLIFLRNKAYFRHLNDNMWQLFSQRDMCNYLMIKFLLYVVLDSTPEFTSLACIKELRNKMDVAVNYLYQRHILSKQIKDIKWDIECIQNRTIKEFSNLFQANRLKLTPQQIALLQEKLKHISLNIGNLPLNPDTESIEKYYENLNELDKNNYFKNHLYLLQHRFQKSLLYAGHQTHYIVSDNKLGSSSSAIYVPKQNMVVFHFASLQVPFYDFSYNALKKYSLLAFILAHEYAHAFDTTGLYYDGYGSSATELSTILDEPNFQDSLKCLLLQLPTESIDERLADIVASRVVFNVFNEYYGSGQYLWQKNFFYSMAQFFCGKTDLEFVDHDSDAERLNQIVMNSETFAYAFQCPLGSKMNPSIKCSVY